MNNFKVMMNGIIKENPTFVLLLGMCPTLGTTSSAINGMGIDLLECGDFFNKEPDSGHGAYPIVYCGDRILRDLASNGDAGLRAGTVCYTRSFHSVDCSELYCTGTCRSLRCQE